MRRGKAAKAHTTADAPPGRGQKNAERHEVLPLDQQLRPGTRVRLRTPAVPLELTSNTGTVVGPAEWDYYYVIQLDRPARYRHVDGRIEETELIRETVDNLDVVEAR